MRKMLYLIAIAMFLQTAQAQNTGLPSDKVALRYRIEFLDKEQWKPVEDDKKFKKNHRERATQ